jgi:hypothetical protein
VREKGTPALAAVVEQGHLAVSVAAKGATLPEVDGRGCAKRAVAIPREASRLLASALPLHTEHKEGLKTGSPKRYEHANSVTTVTPRTVTTVTANRNATVTPAAKTQARTSTAVSETVAM